jgi:hypothetical protein
MSQTEAMLLLMESGFGVREAVFVATGTLPLDVDESARAKYERDIEAILPNPWSVQASVQNRRA